MLKNEALYKVAYRFVSKDKQISVTASTKRRVKKRAYFSPPFARSPAGVCYFF